MVDMETLEYIQTRKTGALFVVAATIGGTLLGAAPEGLEALRQYAGSLGLAYQIVDDILDAVGDEGTVGKDVRKDVDKASVRNGPRRRRARSGRRAELVSRGREDALERPRRGTPRMLERHQPHTASSRSQLRRTGDGPDDLRRDTRGRLGRAALADEHAGPAEAAAQLAGDAHPRRRHARRGWRRSCRCRSDARDDGRALSGTAMLNELPAVPAQARHRRAGREEHGAGDRARGASFCSREDPDAVMVVLPADHVIGDDGAFRASDRSRGRGRRSNRALVTLGITPDEARDRVRLHQGRGTSVRLTGVLEVASFDREAGPPPGGGLPGRGRILLEQRDVRLAGRRLPRRGGEPSAGRLALLSRTSRALPGTRASTTNWTRFYGSVPADIRRLRGHGEGGRGARGPGRLRLGRRRRVARAWQDMAGVTTRGTPCRGDAVLIDSSDCIAYSESGTVAVLGMSGVVVVRTPDATLVCPRTERATSGRLWTPCAHGTRPVPDGSRVLSGPSREFAPRGPRRPGSLTRGHRSGSDCCFDTRRPCRTKQRRPQQEKRTCTNGHQEEEHAAAEKRPGPRTVGHHRYGTRQAADRLRAPSPRDKKGGFCPF